MIFRVGKVPAAPPAAHFGDGYAVLQAVATEIHGCFRVRCLPPVQRLCPERKILTLLAPHSISASNGPPRHDDDGRSLATANLDTDVPVVFISALRSGLWPLSEVERPCLIDDLRAEYHREAMTAFSEGYGCRPARTSRRARGPASVSLRRRNPRVVTPRPRRALYGDCG